MSVVGKKFFKATILNDKEAKEFFEKQNFPKELALNSKLSEEYATMVSDMKRLKKLYCW